VIAGLRVFDTHTHMGRARHSGRMQTMDDMLRSMDKSGVDRSLLIPFPAVDDHAREHNEIAAALCAHPDRFCAAACVHPFAPEFRDEVRRCAVELGFVALKLQPQFHPLNPLSPRSDFFWEAALDHDLPVIVHTGAGAPLALPSLYIDVARRFPALRIVLAHSGGSSYFLEAIVAAKTCPNIWLELSSLMPHHITEVLAHVGEDRLMIGSDLPESVETEIGKIVSLARPAILWDTPVALFRRR